MSRPGSAFALLAASLVGCAPAHDSTLEPSADLSDDVVSPFVPADSVGKPWGAGSALGQFRGNPTHTFHGTGLIPGTPERAWRFPDQPMCGTSYVGGQPKVWCGTGWTGQPAIWQRDDGVTEVIVGAYDKKVHFLDLATGQRTRPDFTTGDIIKGSVTIDPDGYPLLYFGSRDNKLRVVALDRETPTELWSLDAGVVNGMWNNDWDGNPSIVDDVLFEGGENSYFFAVKLGRHFDADGKVAVSPQRLVSLRGWTDDLLARVGDRNASIENSVAIFEDRVYFANGHGRVVGVDISDIGGGQAPVVFDFWAGDDIDASIVIDGEGMLYVTAELERNLPRALEVGQFLKLDPYRSGDPVVWSVDIPGKNGDSGGSWATPALGDGVLYLPTHAGDLLTVDSATGDVIDRQSIGPHAWSSPSLIGDRLLVATCIPGGLSTYDVSNPREPARIGRYDHPACIESTPAIHDGQIVVGSRDGYLYSFR